MSSLKRKRNLLDDKQKREIISYAKENPKLTQQIANNMTIKWDLFILMHLYKCKMYVSRVETIWESLSFHLITWLPVFNVPQFIVKLVIPPNYRLHKRWRFNKGALYLVMKSTLWDILISKLSPLTKLDNWYKKISSLCSSLTKLGN
jgi:hypothetical protein